MSQRTLDQLRRHGLTPDTSYGQHFLIDDNVLGVIERMSGAASDDVVYEPGAGVGVLTGFLAERVRFVHAAELDARLRNPLDELEEEHSNIRVHWGDAVKLAPGSLDPVPGKLISNLPYNVAAPIIAECLQHAPCLRGYCVMVQREIADRMFAEVGAKNYGALSVFVQALCERTGTHAVSRAVFAPPPNVDSLLVAFRRREDAEIGLQADRAPAFSKLVRTSFAHRRKTLANNLNGYDVCGHQLTRAEVVGSLERLGHAPAARPQELSAAQFVLLFRDVESLA